MLSTEDRDTSIGRNAEMMMIDFAEMVSALTAPPSGELEKLSGRGGNDRYNPESNGW